MLAMRCVPDRRVLFSRVVSMKRQDLCRSRRSHPRSRLESAEAEELAAVDPVKGRGRRRFCSEAHGSAPIAVDDHIGTEAERRASPSGRQVGLKMCQCHLTIAKAYVNYP